MDKDRERIKNAIQYFNGMKPSDFTVVGVVNPRRWREFREFLKLVDEFIIGGQKEKKE